jgi:hypothetical protein
MMMTMTKKMIPKISCNKFSIKIIGEVQVNIDLDFDTEKWVMSYGFPDNETIPFDSLEEAVINARKIAGDKIV